MLALRMEHYDIAIDRKDRYGKRGIAFLKLVNWKLGIGIFLKQPVWRPCSPDVGVVPCL